MNEEIMMIFSSSMFHLAQEFELRMPCIRVRERCDCPPGAAARVEGTQGGQQHVEMSVTGCRDLKLCLCECFGT